MKQLALIVAVVVLLLVGGGLTAQLISNQGSAPLPVLQQAGDPNASVSEMLPWKAEQFFLLVGFLLFNLVGIGVTIAVIMWFLDRGVRTSRPEGSQKGGKQIAQAQQQRE